MGPTLPIKSCSKCGLSKPLDEFHKQKDKSDGLRPSCKNCRRRFYYENHAKIRRQAKKHREKVGPEVTRDRYLRYNYGITLVEFEALLEKQGYVCALCHSDDPKHKLGWNLDHCHETGKIRGILCHNCNTKLGHLEKFLKYVNLDKIYGYMKGDTYGA